jgi:uncharacterized protein YlxP (DUF503 family)
VAVHVLTITFDVHVPLAHSLKDKRAVVKTILEGGRRRFHVAGAETDHQDKWQRAELAFVAVSSSQAQVEQIIDEVERFVWSFPEAEVLSAERFWTETD